MARYWWVNHKQSAGRMIEGGYLWSPKNAVRKHDGKLINNETYNNMRRVSPDDLIVSFTDQRVSYIGRATEYAFTSKKPLALAPLNTAWDQQGWLLPVSWTGLENPVTPREHIALIAEYLRYTNAPMKADGYGNQNVFLAEIPIEIFEVLCGLAGFDPALAGVVQTSSLTPEMIDDEVAQRILSSDAQPITEANALVTARRGQGKFRQNVGILEAKCRLTGVSNPRLLIASHIKPWRDCESSERLDGSNGLLLTPNADRLFDRGFITFHDDGLVEVSSRLPSFDLTKFGFKEGQKSGRRILEAVEQKAFSQSQRQYLEYHRRQVFLPAA